MEVARTIGLLFALVSTGALAEASLGAIGVAWGGALSALSDDAPRTNLNLVLLRPSRWLLGSPSAARGTLPLSPAGVTAAPLPRWAPHLGRRPRVALAVNTFSTIRPRRLPRWAPGSRSASVLLYYDVSSCRRRCCVLWLSLASWSSLLSLRLCCFYYIMPLATGSAAGARAARWRAMAGLASSL